MPARLYPAVDSSTPVGAAVAGGTGVIPSTGAASRARTTSRPGRGLSQSTLVASLPGNTTWVSPGGAPSSSRGWAGSAARQLAAPSAQRGATSVTVHSRPGAASLPTAASSPLTGAGPVPVRSCTSMVGDASGSAPRPTCVLPSGSTSTVSSSPSSPRSSAVTSWPVPRRCPSPRISYTPGTARFSTPEGAVTLKQTRPMPSEPMASSVVQIFSRPMSPCAGVAQSASTMWPSPEISLTFWASRITAASGYGWRPSPTSDGGDIADAPAGEGPSAADRDAAIAAARPSVAQRGGGLMVRNLRCLLVANRCCRPRHAPVTGAGGSSCGLEGERGLDRQALGLVGDHPRLPGGQVDCGDLGDAGVFQELLAFVSQPDALLAYVLSEDHLDLAGGAPGVGQGHLVPRVVHLPLDLGPRLVTPFRLRDSAAVHEDLEGGAVVALRDHSGLVRSGVPVFVRTHFGTAGPEESGVLDAGVVTGPHGPDFREDPLVLGPDQDDLELRERT